MKLVIQIPCYNEEQTLPEVLMDLPKSLDGVDSIQTLVIDDGSTDQTAEIARQAGADRVIRFSRNRGLARAFASGLETSLQVGADIVVNTDGDHQYKGGEIADLIAPIIRGDADMVVGDRRTWQVSHFSWAKKILQRAGTQVVRWTSGTDIGDATSGFRAMSRRAAARFIVFSSYTYTLETIIQAGKSGLVVLSVPVEINSQRRESRLISSVPGYVIRSAITILRIFLMYEPLRVFSALSVFPLVTALGLFGRYAYYFVVGEGLGHIQSVVVASGLLVLAFQVFLLGLLADLIAKNRRLNEDIHFMIRDGSSGKNSGVRDGSS